MNQDERTALEIIANDAGQAAADRQAALDALAAAETIEEALDALAAA